MPTSESSDILSRLQALSDPGYQDFIANLLPTVDRERIIGVRAPDLRKLARELRKSGAAQGFMQDVPHQYHEENMLHAYVLCLEKDIDRALSGTEAFLPYVDNWAVCDSLKPAAFPLHPQAVAQRIPNWLNSPLPYVQRFGFVVLLNHFVEEHFDPIHLDWAASHKNGEYYVDMARAWYLSMALVYQWDAAYPVIAESKLDRWTHLKTIQKAVESRQISAERKELLKSFR